MRPTVDHSRSWLTRHSRGRGLFLTPYSFVINYKLEYLCTEVSYYVWKEEFRSYIGDN